MERERERERSRRESERSRERERERRGLLLPLLLGTGGWKPPGRMKSPAAGGSPAVARAGVAGGHPRGEIGRGQQPPPSNKPRPGHVALAGPNPGRISAARGQREIAGGPPALGRWHRPGVAAGHPKSEEESG